MAKQSNPLTPHERRLAAVQESGRALITWLLPKTSQFPLKVSIVPRTSASGDASGLLGFTNIISEQRYLLNNEELADRMAIILGGRAAERIVFDVVSDSQFILQIFMDVKLFNDIKVFRCMSCFYFLKNVF